VANVSFGAKIQCFIGIFSAQARVICGCARVIRVIPVFVQ
jgi:hypothetical protein